MVYGKRRHDLALRHRSLLSTRSGRPLVLSTSIGLFVSPWKAGQLSLPGFRPHLIARSSQSPPEPTNRPEVVHRRRSSHVRPQIDAYRSADDLSPRLECRCAGAAHPPADRSLGGTVGALQLRQYPLSPVEPCLGHPGHGGGVRPELEGPVGAFLLDG